MRLIARLLAASLVAHEFAPPTGGGGTPTPPPTPTPAPAPVAAPPAPTPTPTPAPGGPAPSPTPGTAQPPVAGGPSPTPDTIPYHRFAEVVAARARADAQAEQYRRMVEATGVTLPQPADPRITAAQEQFAMVQPGLASLEQHAPLLLKMVEALTQGKVDPSVFGRMNDFVSAEDQRWEAHGQGVRRTLAAELRSDFNADLTPAQLDGVAIQMESWILSDRSGMRHHRYNIGDPTLTQEFLAAYREMFIAPFRPASPAPGAPSALPSPVPPVAGAPSSIPALSPNARRAAQAAHLPPVPGQGIVPAPPAAPLTDDQVHDNAWNTMRQIMGR